MTGRIANFGDGDWGKILDDPAIPYRRKVNLVAYILETRLGKGAVYLGNKQNYIVPINRAIDFDKEERIRLASDLAREGG